MRETTTTTTTCLTPCRPCRPNRRNWPHIPRKSSVKEALVSSETTAFGHRRVHHRRRHIVVFALVKASVSLDFTRARKEQNPFQFLVVKEIVEIPQTAIAIERITVIFMAAYEYTSTSCNSIALFMHFQSSSENGKLPPLQLGPPYKRVWSYTLPTSYNIWSIFSLHSGTPTSLLKLFGRKFEKS